MCEGEREPAEVGRETCTGDQNVRVTGTIANILGMTEYRYIAAAEVYSTGGDIVSRAYEYTDELLTNAASVEHEVPRSAVAQTPQQCRASKRRDARVHV